MVKATRAATSMPTPIAMLRTACVLNAELNESKLPLRLSPNPTIDFKSFPAPSTKPVTAENSFDKSKNPLNIAPKAANWAKVFKNFVMASVLMFSTKTFNASAISFNAEERILAVVFKGCRKAAISISKPLMASYALLTA